MKPFPHFLLLLALMQTSCSSVVSPPPSAGEKLLADALQSGLPLQVRLRSDLYQPGNQEKITNQRQRLAKAQSYFEAMKDPNPEAVIALALIDLMLGRSESPLERLEQALTIYPDHPELLNALAVTHLAQGEAKHLTQALEAITLAAQVAPTAEIRFNHAVVLQQLQLRYESQAAWQLYLAMDDPPGWKAEANKRMNLNTVNEESPLDREIAEEELLPLWAEGHSEALMPLRDLAEKMLQNSGDQALRDEVAVLTKAKNKQGLRLAHRLFHQAARADRDFLVETSRPLLEQALPLFQQEQSVYRFKTIYALAVNDFRMGKHRAAANQLERLSKDLPANYIEMRASTLWMIALIHQLAERPILAQDAYEQSRELLLRLDETIRLAGINNLLAEVDFFLGDVTKAWQNNQTARDMLSTSPPSMALYIANAWAAEMAARDGKLRSACHFQNEAVAIARKLEQPLTLGLALLERAQIQLGLNPSHGATKDLDEAVQLVPLQPNAAWHDMLTRLHLTRARLHDGQRRLPILDTALTHAQKTGLPHLMAQIYLVRAQTHRALGRLDQAHEDLDRGIESCEQVRSRLPNRNYQDRYFQARRSLYDDMISFQALERNQPELALSYAERLRAPDHAQSSATDQGSGLGATLITYIVQEQHILAWCIRGTDTHFFVLPMKRKQLRQKIATLTNQMDTRTNISAIASDLYQALLQPMAHLLQPKDALVFIPDQDLNELPFAALFRPDSGRYLVQDHTLSYAASSHGYRSGTRQSFNSKQQVLLVGNPSFDKRLYPTLGDLPHAAQEVRDIAALYPNHSLLPGGQATPERLLAEASQYGIIHYSGHSLSTGASMGLVMATQPGQMDDGLLQASEIAAINLKNTWLVVLAACRSIKGKGSEPGLAQAFLEAGVQMVVASSRDVRDRQTADFFRHFHHLLGQGLGPSNALQQTQIHMLTKKAHPAAWADFRLITKGPL